MARRTKGAFAAGNTRKSSSTSSNAVSSDAVSSNDEEGAGEVVSARQQRRGASIWKYLIFAVVAFVGSVVAATAFVSPLGVVVAGVGKVDSNTNMLDMLNGWFFPMLTISLIVAALTVMVLRRAWHGIEKRFG